MGVNAATNSAKHKSVVDDRRARVASFKCQGLSIRETIAALTAAKCLNPKTGRGWSLGIIQEDLDWLTARWKENAARDIGEVKARELAELDEMEREAWAAWRRSIGKHQVCTRKTGRVTKDGAGIAGAEVSTRAEDLAGDPRYLQIILDVKARRAALLGMDAPKNMHLGGKVTWEQLVTGEGLDGE